MGNWYKVTKKIHGRLYDYWQRTYRVGKSVKTENRYIGPTFGRNDRVLLIHNATGATQQRNVRAVSAGNLLVTDDISGIPYKASLDSWYVRLVSKGDPHAPPPKTGITFKELAEQEQSDKSAANSRSAQAPISSQPTTVTTAPPYTQDDAMMRLDPLHDLDAEWRKKVQKAHELERRDDERIQYGPRGTRIRKHAAMLRKAKRKTKGIKSLNPF